MFIVPPDRQGVKKRFAPTGAVCVWGWLLLPFAVIVPAVACGAEQHGFVSVEDYYSKYSNSLYTQHLLTTRLRLDVSKLNGSGDMSFHFDGRDRLNLGSDAYGGSGKELRIDALNFEYSPGRIYLAAGRLWPKDIPLERIDGVNMAYQSNGLGAGAFAGAHPDPYTETFSTDRGATGAYAFIRKDKGSADLAFTHNTYKGGTDRQYMFGQVSYSLPHQLLFYGTATADIDQITNKAGLTSGIMELTYRPDFAKSITAGYNQFRSIRLYKSMASFMDSRQTAYYLSGNYRFKERYGLYGRVERQTSVFPSTQLQPTKSTGFRAGLSVEDLFGTGFNSDASVSRTDGDSVKLMAYHVEVSRMLRDSIQLMLNGSYSRSDYPATGYASDVWTYGAFTYLRLAKVWVVYVSYEREQGADYSADRVMSSVSFKF